MHGDGWNEANATLDRMPVKSTIDVTGPLEAGRMTVLRGRAWAGEATVGVVEVSTDGGDTWDEATLTGPNEPSSWVEWEHAWTPGAAGPHELVSRATDSLGRTQPDAARRERPTATSSTPPSGCRSPSPPLPPAPPRAPADASPARRPARSTRGQRRGGGLQITVSEGV